jgi:bleomycin hydrolase
VVPFSAEATQPYRFHHDCAFEGYDQGEIEMSRSLAFLAILVLGILLCGSAAAQKDKAEYVPKVEYPLFKEIKQRMDSIGAANDSLTSAIRDRQKKAREFKDSIDTELRFDVSRIDKPSLPEEFKPVFHFPPTPQDWSSTCWAFNGTSFVESEVCRLTGRKIKLSEVYTVYFEYVEKARRYVRERGESAVGPGSQDGAVLMIMKQYGAVPRELFDGLNPDFMHYMHSDVDGEISKYLDYVKEHSLWNEDAVIASVRVILDRYIGRPPEKFEFEGTTCTPIQFATEVLGIRFDDYMAVMSTLKSPFFTRGLFDVSDNWRRDSSFYNLPLDVWYGVIRNAIRSGYSVAIGGGNSEPGYNGVEGIAVIPDFDIPQSFINQDSREYRIYRGTTGDDHGLHLVGYLRKGDRDWFLIKDSGSGSRKGKHNGYFFFRDDYVRLKMLTFIVHKDLVQGIVEGKTDKK